MCSIGKALLTAVSMKYIHTYIKYNYVYVYYMYMCFSNYFNTNFLIMVF